MPRTICKALRDAVKALGLEADTDIVTTADHGFLGDVAAEAARPARPSSATPT